MFKLENNPLIEFFMEKGIQKGIQKVAIEMLRDDVDIRAIAKYTKMPVEWVEGIERGMKKGEQESKQKVTLAMLDDGVDIEKIAKYVKMPVEWVEGMSKEAEAQLS